MPASAQKIKAQPRKLLRAIPGLEFREIPLSDICCGSAGVRLLGRGQRAVHVVELLDEAYTGKSQPRE